MKTNSIPRNVQIAAAESSQFTVTNNAKIFRILIDGLYADKVQSITREIWSNALDAHTQAGCADVPFSVSFPNSFDPTFRVRDYGVSLSHDQVMHMYTDLGYSTKEDSNDAIGKFGIGSKSPFAYTDNFTVTAFLDGEARYYSAMIGADSVPSIHLLGRQPTEERNGIEVSFPVDVCDFKEFRTAANRVSHGFKVKPLVDGAVNEGWPTLDTLIEGNGWTLMRGAIDGHSGVAYARMGPVLYPIKASALGEIGLNVKEIIGHTFIIDFPMGDLEITASREELAYGRNDPTRTSIINRAAEIYDELWENCRSALVNCETYYGACQKYHGMLQSAKIPSGIMKRIQQEVKWNGHVLSDVISLSVRQRGWDVCFIGTKQITNQTYRFKYDNKNNKVPVEHKTLVVVEDHEDGSNTKRAAYRINDYVKNHSGHKQVVWVRVYRVGDCTDDLFNLFETLDGVDTILLSDIPMPVNIRSSYASTRRPVMVRRLADGGFDRTVSLDEGDFERGGVYVPLLRGDAIVPDGCSYPYRLMAALGALDVLDQPVYGAPKSLIKKFSGDQWINLYDLAAEWADSNPFDIPTALAEINAIAEVRQSVLLDFIAENILRDKIGHNSPCKQASDFRARTLTFKRSSKVTNHVELNECLGRPIGAVATTHEVTDELELVEDILAQAYPLLPLLAKSNIDYMEGCVDTVTDYVIMCDNVSKTNQSAARAA